MKVQVNLNDDMVAKIDKLAKEIGVSRSSYCAMLIGQGVNAANQTYDLIKGLNDNISNVISKNLKSKQS